MKPQTQLHVLSNCSKCLDRYTWRHDSVLSSLTNQLTKFMKPSMELYCDCNKLPFRSTSEVFEKQRPDLVIKQTNSITATEFQLIR